MVQYITFLFIFLLAFANSDNSLHHRCNSDEVTETNVAYCYPAMHAAQAHPYGQDGGKSYMTGSVTNRTLSWGCDPNI